MPLCIGLVVGFTRRKDRPSGAACFAAERVDGQDARSSRLRCAASAAGREAPHPYVPQPTKSVATPLPPAVKGEVLAMLACGCAWLRSRFVPLTAVAASLFERCRLRRNAGLCLTRGMRGIMEGGSGRTLSLSLTMRGSAEEEPSRSCKSQSQALSSYSGAYAL